MNERAVCQHCGKTVDVFPRGAGLVYGWHLNGEILAERCVGVQSIVEPAAMRSPR